MNETAPSIFRHANRMRERPHGIAILSCSILARGVEKDFKGWGRLSGLVIRLASPKNRIRN
jgi:hypothetical protein